ncbi:conserved hypothetical protein [Trichinella spiralis]|uniref:hypothetical protein n=1 Tax=Trichinella spiralis TaxID=6334 RepID=UPI0001EFDBC4|nr:conserved hypothetical protein [Trichinella spiralis]
MRLCYCLAGSDTWPMIDIRFAVTPLTSSFGVAPFISLGIKHLKLISIENGSAGQYINIEYQAARLSRRDDSHLPGSARHLVRKLRLRRIRMAIWSVEGGSDGSTQGHLGQNREASTWARRR